MICDTCFKMLRGQDGRIWKGTYDLNFNHHTQMKDLRRSADMHCGICRVLFAELRTRSGSGARESSVSKDPESTQLSSDPLQSTIQLIQTYWMIAQIIELLCALRVLIPLQGLYRPSQSEAKSEGKIMKTIAATPVTDGDDFPLCITASLRFGQQKTVDGLKGSGELYYLTFKLRYGHTRCRRVFALSRTGTKPAIIAHSVEVLLMI
jgi:hypothetical protein